MFLFAVVVLITAIAIMYVIYIADVVDLTSLATAISRQVAGLGQISLFPILVHSSLFALLSRILTKRRSYDLHGIHFVC